MLENDFKIVQELLHVHSEVVLVLFIGQDDAPIVRREHRAALHKVQDQVLFFRLKIILIVNA